MQEYNHNKYMELALSMAAKARGYTAPNPMVGCILVNNQKIIGQGYHKNSGQEHAEVNAINDAIKIGNASKIAGSTCYVSLEPCCHYGKTGPCVDKLIEYKVSHVVCAIQDPNPLVAGNGIAHLRQHGILVTCGVLSDEAYELNRGFISRVILNRPFITSKIAASLDGYTALANGESKWITNSESRNDVHKYRLYSDAIVTTANTVIADNPSLNCRYQDSELNIPIKQPLRVVIDTNLRTSPESKIYTIDSNCIIITADQVVLDDKFNKKFNKFLDIGIKIYTFGKLGDFIDIAKVWQLLAELDCNEVMIEAGAIFNGNLLKDSLADEWLIYQSGTLMGEGARNMFSLNSEENPFDSMSDLFKLKCKQIKQLQDNWRLTCSPV